MTLMSSANPRTASKRKQPRAIKCFFMAISRNSDPCYGPRLAFVFPLAHSEWGLFPEISLLGRLTKRSWRM